MGLNCSTKPDLLFFIIKNTAVTMLHVYRTTRQILVLQFLIIPWQGHSAQFIHKYIYFVAVVIAFFLIDGPPFQMSIKIRASE